MRTIGEAATELRALKEQLDQQEEQTKAIKRRIDAITKEEIPKLMEDTGVDNYRVPGVGTVYLIHETFAYCKKEFEDQFFAWLRENGHGDIIKETVHPKTLVSFAKEQLHERGQPLPDFVTTSFATKAAIRRS